MANHNPRRAPTSGKPDVFKRLSSGETVLSVPTAKRPSEVIRVVEPKG